MRTIKVKLEDPIQVDGKEVAELEVRKPTVKELKKAKKLAGDDMFDRTVIMVGDLTTLSPEQVDDLSVMDFVNIQKEMENANFLPKGETPSS